MTRERLKKCPTSKESRLYTNYRCSLLCRPQSTSYVYQIEFGIYYSKIKDTFVHFPAMYFLFGMRCQNRFLNTNFDKIPKPRSKWPEKGILTECWKGVQAVRIGIDARYLYSYFTGVGRYSFNLIRHLAAIDRENQYVILKNRDRKDPIVDQENFLEIPTSTPPISLGTWFYIPCKLLRKKIDLFHSHFPVAPLSQPFRSVVTVHDLQAVRAPGFSSNRAFWLETGAECFYRLAYPLSMKKAKRIIAVSYATKAAAMDFYGLPGEKIKVIHEAVEAQFRPILDKKLLDEFREKMRLPERFLLYVGNTRPHKNVDGLLRGFCEFLRLNEVSEAIYLVIAGAKERFYPARRNLAEQLGIRQRVVFIPYIPEEDLPLLYNLCEVFIFVTLFEGFGLPPLEAMACGIPVIASNHSALPEALGNQAILVDPHEPKAIGRAIQRILRDRALRRQLKEKGLQWVKNFSWDLAAQRTLQVYHQVLKEATAVS